ncbi:hypothetical protein TIFTF001_035907 [Ficus carica]|uniref:Uncharacterized protein n=1 Tax=Ficus carica TaxID=3494 RepID=A0AA88E6N7_FICCA|nr:hypothetical protein TIFTF001_035879 [Ficus carica]GMN66824.1 hypothetical protein TIFTF001_035885 [Ficus carica]GMN66833.1 hypothetical protein TIFTF001_035901 [Ficus carica]GMN66846.1 hypothetical protein TIFTF001_035907 [Ficus carica]
MPEISGETAAGKDEGAQGEVEEGEVTGEARVAEDVVVIDEPVTPVDNLQTEQPVPTDHQPTSVDNIFIFLWAWGCPYYWSRDPVRGPRTCGLEVYQSRLVERSCSGNFFGWLGCSLERPKSNSGRYPKQEPFPWSRTSRLGPTLAPPLVGLGVPWNDPSPTLVGIQNEDPFPGPGTSGLRVY